MIVRDEMSARLDRVLRVVAGMLCLAAGICAAYVAVVGGFECVRLLRASQTPHSGWFGFSLFVGAVAVFAVASLFIALRLLLRGPRII